MLLWRKMFSEYIYWIDMSIFDGFLTAFGKLMENWSCIILWVCEWSLNLRLVFETSVNALTVF